MKKTIMTLALAAVCCLGASAQEKLFNSASVQSPVVNKDGTVTFNLFAPKAVKVEVTGYEYEFMACRKALIDGLLEPVEMPHEETLYIMELMDGLRKKWGVHYPMDDEQ